MPRNRTLPGSIYAQKGRGKLIIKFAGAVVHTGLKDTKEGRKIANEMLEKMYLESKGIGKKEKTANPSIHAAFEDFLLTYCATLRQRSLEQYIYAFRAVFSSAKELNAKNVEASILAYLKTAQQRGLAQMTVNNYLNRVHTFLRWCEERYNFPRTDFKKMYSKPVTIHVETYTHEECRAILAACQASHSDSVREMGVMIGFMLETGARLGDCLTMKPFHIKQGAIAFTNKITKEPELTPISEKAQHHLSRLEKRENRVFRWSNESTSRLHRQLRYVMQECGIEQSGRSFQEFRTTFRNRLLDAGIQPEIAMRLMRHRDMRTTLRYYTKFTDEAMKNALKKAAFGSEKVADSGES